MLPDIRSRIESDFGQDAAEAIGLLEAFFESGEPRADDRLLRCIIHLAGGRLDRLTETLQLARTDWRDVMWAAEYDCTELQKRDLSRPFDL